MAMPTAQEIDRIGRFDAEGARVLSVYLDLDPAPRRRRTHKVAFRDLVREAGEGLDEAARESLASEAQRVQIWLDQGEPEGKGLAVFSCELKRLWRADWLAVRMPNHLAWEERPDIAPLLEVLDEYERYAVAVVDQQAARLLTVFAGEIEQSNFLEHEPAGESRPRTPARYERHREAQVYRHLKRTAERLAELHRRRSFDRLILAGHKEVTSELRRLMARALAQRVVAEVTAKPSVADREILDKTLEIERRIEQRAEDGLIRKLLDLVGPNGRAALGPAATLAALWNDLVQTLVVAHGTHLEGSECRGCGRLETGQIERCPACGQGMRAVHDLFHAAMARAREQSASVEVVHGTAAARLAELGQGLAALLRRPTPVPTSAVGTFPKTP